MKMLYHPKRILGFETYVAPEGFDRKAQPVDIYDVFERYYRNHRDAKYIFSVADSFTPKAGLTGSEMPLMEGVTFVYGYELAGVKYRVNLNKTTRTLTGAMNGNYSSIPVTSTEGFPDSGKITVGGSLGTMYGWGGQIFFTYTSKDETNFYGTSQYIYTRGDATTNVYPVINWVGTKRWVIVEDPLMIYAHLSYTNGPVWLYCGKGITQVATGDTSTHHSSIKYIHVHKLNDITYYNYASHWQNEYLTGTLHISTSATGIYALAFAGCTGITGTLIIPGNIKFESNYGYGSFSGCTGIQSLILNEGIEKIGYNTFSGCTGLNGTLTIPNSCTVIEYNAFYNCNKLDTLDLGTGVQTIGNSAFQACAQLSGTLTLPDSLTTIGTLAFYGCTSFSGTLTIPANITSIGQGAFGDDNFTDIDVTANSRYEDVDDVLYEISTRTALHSVKGDTGTITFQSNTLIIGDYCCLRNQRTGTLTVPDSVTRVGIYAFYDCDGFTALDLETTTSALATIDDYAFAYQSNLAGTITIPNSVTLIDQHAFRDIPKITAIVIGNGVVTIGSSAFLNDVAVTAITFGSGLITIGADAFRQMTAISENLVIPNSVETIGATAFCNNTSRTGTLTLGTGTKTIGGQAFGNVPFSGTLTIPSAVTAIGEGAFWNNNFTAIASSATGFTVYDYVLYDETASGQIKAHTSARGYAGTLTFKAGTTSILLYCLYNNDNRTGAIVIPYTVTAIGQQAFDDCSGFNSTATIGDATNGSGLTSIGFAAFRGCPNITGWNIYRTPAPTCNQSFSNYAKPLHVKSGATGYDVTPATNAAPWTNTAIFSSVTYDL